MKARQLSQQSRIEHAVEDMRLGGDDLGQPRRRRHDVDDEEKQGRIVAQQREKLNAGRQAGDEVVEAQQGLVGTGALAEDAQELGRQLRQPLACFHRLRRAVAAVMPGADDVGDVGGALEAELEKRRQRVGVVALASEDEIAGLA